RPRPLAPRRASRPENLDRGDGALADLLGDAALELRQQQPDLRRPGGGVRAHDARAVLEGLRHAVVGDAVADDLAPPADDAAHLQRSAPAELRAQQVDGVAERLRVAAGTVHDVGSVVAGGAPPTSTRAAGAQPLLA